MKLLPVETTDIKVQCLGGPDHTIALDWCDSCSAGVTWTEAPDKTDPDLPLGKCPWENGGVVHCGCGAAYRVAVLDFDLDEH